MQFRSSMRKIILSLLAATASLTAATQAVVFDWGNVLATPDRFMIVDFLCQTFALSETEFDAINLEKKQVLKKGKSEIDFWHQLAKKKGITLPPDWATTYREVLKKSVGTYEKMYEIVYELKKKQIKVGMLSNIDDRYVKLIKEFGFYTPFDPCLLSCEIGLEKPDPKAYQELLKAIKLPASDIVFIDDKIENVEAAKKMGIDAIAFTSAEQIRVELSKRGLMDYIQETAAKKFVIGVPLRTSNATCIKEMPPFWEKFNREHTAKKIPNRKNHDLLAVYTDYEGDYTKSYTYVIGCEVSSLDSIPEGMVGIEIPASTYAVFTAKGDFPQSMGQAWVSIWNTALKRTYTQDIEVYSADFNPQNKPDVKIYISIEK